MKTISKVIPDYILDAFREKNFDVIVNYIGAIQELKSVRDEDQNTLIHLAALHNFPEVIFECAERWPNDILAAVNIQNTEGDTPIHLAVRDSRFKKNSKDIDYEDSCHTLRLQYVTKKILFLVIRLESAHMMYLLYYGL